MIDIQQYDQEKKQEWDHFVKNAKNGYFFALRDYIGYHEIFHPKRFIDHSLMFYYKNELIAVMPANIDDNTLHSHGGLTFGGLISNRRIRVPIMLKLFDKLEEYCKSLSIKTIIYKSIPYIYHLLPSEEDLYALFRKNAFLFRRDVSTTIYLPRKIKFSENRLRGIKKAKSMGVVVKETQDFDAYWTILSRNLMKRYGKKPTHTIDEIKYLKKQFPSEIKLFGAYLDNNLIAGTVIYETNKNVAHAQYIAASDTGKKIGALDLIFSYLINEYYTKINTKLFFDFGISTENQGRFLNEGLISQKEGFGGRATVYDFYEWKLD